MAEKHSDAVSAHPAGQAKRQHCISLNLYGWWAWELVAAVVAVAAMGALLGVLAAADGQPQQSWAIGNTQLTINSIIAAIGTVVRLALLATVAGALNQTAWNWFASSVHGLQWEGRRLDDLETFGEAAASPWKCLKLLWRTRCLYGMDKRSCPSFRLTGMLETSQRPAR